MGTVVAVDAGWGVSVAAITGALVGCAGAVSVATGVDALLQPASASAATSIVRKKSCFDCIGLLCFLPAMVGLVDANMHCRQGGAASKKLFENLQWKTSEVDGPIA